MGPALKRRVTKTSKDEPDQEEVHPARKLAKVVGEDSAKRVKRVSLSARSPKAASEEADGLKGLKVVLTGLTDIYTRDDLEARLKNAGAHVISAVSGVTNVLVYGSKLEDGREVTAGSKYRKAEELIRDGKSKGGLRILSEKEFVDEFEELKPKPVPLKALSCSTLSQNTLWSERWRPKSREDFVFNSAPYQSLENWLDTWTSGQEDAKGALLAGPPGVGKTSAVLSVAANHGYSLKEFNASDTRSQKALRNLQALVSGGISLSKGLVQSKMIILMDEADGLSAGDRGGSQELVKLIKESRLPIICTCNDKQHAKVRTLAKICRVINFNPPDRTSAVSRVVQIARAEGWQVQDRFVDELFDACGGDMRQLLNSVQMALVSRGGSDTSAEKGIRKFVFRDTSSADDAFSAVRKMFMMSSTELTQRQRLDCFFLDYDMVPMLVAENALKNIIKLGEAGIEIAASISDSIAYSDQISSRVRAQGYWDLLPDVGFFSTVLPTMMVKPAGLLRADFPRYLGRISSTNKHKRQFGELATKIGRSGRRLIADGYFEYLGEKLVEPLLTGAKDPSAAIETFMEKLDQYNLTRDLVVENLMETRAKQANNPYDKVDSKIKAMLSRFVKSSIAPGYLVKSTTTGSRKKTGAKAKAKGKAKAVAKRAAKSKPSPLQGDDDTEAESDDAVGEEEDARKEREEEEARMASIF